MLLREYRVDVIAIDNYANTALNVACHYDHRETILMLLGHERINVDPAKVHRITPLMLASHRSLKFSQRLKKQCVDAVGNNGLAALDISADPKNIRFKP